MTTIVKGIEAGGDIKAGRDLIVHEASPSAPPPVAKFRTAVAPIKNFQGRESLIKLIHEKLTECLRADHWSDRTLTLVGLGGMGKTEVARKFLEIHEKSYPNVAWINAETDFSISESFRNLADLLELPWKGDERGIETARRVFSHVGQHVPSSLFVFDNANGLHTEEGSFGILEYLPRQKYANPPLCLITSQTMDWEAQNFPTLDVEALTQEESVQYLLARFGLSEAKLEEDKHLDVLIQKLCACVQGYPMGLQLAAANVGYMPQRDPPRHLQKRLETFVARLNELDDKCVMEKPVKAGTTDYDRTFRVIWDITMDRIRGDEHSSEALRLLKILACTDPGEAPCKDVKDAYDAWLCDEAKMSGDEDTIESTPEGGLRALIRGLACFLPRCMRRAVSPKMSPQGEGLTPQHLSLSSVSGDESFDLAMHLLLKLVLVQTWNNYKAEQRTRMHRMVQSFARREDSEGWGLRYILQTEKYELTRHFFSTQAKLAIPASVLASDQLIITWLRCFIEHSISVNVNPNEATLVFDSSYERKLRKRKSHGIEDILATVELVRKLQSLEWKDDFDTKICGLVDYAKRIKPGSGLACSLFDLAVRLMNRALYRAPVFYGVESSKGPTEVPITWDASVTLKLKEWLHHPDTMAVRASYEDQTYQFAHLLQEVANQQGSDGQKPLVEQYREDFAKDFHVSWSDQNAYPEMRHDLVVNTIALVKDPFLGPHQTFPVVRSLLQDHKLVTKFMAETKINLWLARRLEVEHEKVAREFGMDPVETGGASSSTAEPASAPPPPLDPDYSRKCGAVKRMYIGYVVCYSLALCDHDNSGQSFFEKLRKWMPCLGYLKVLPLYLKAATDNECATAVTSFLKLERWNMEDDRPVFERVLSEVSKESGPDAGLNEAHALVVKALQHFNTELLEQPAAICVRKPPGSIDSPVLQSFQLNLCMEDNFSSYEITNQKY